MANTLTSLSKVRKHRRLFRILGIYQDAIVQRDLFDQLHQAARCVEGLLLAEQGQSQRRFKSRTELFIGPGHHEVMEDVYQLRSAVEHVNDHLFLETWSRERRIEILRNAIFIGHVAQVALVRIFEHPKLLEHFIDDTAIKSFWTMPFGQREQLWGPAIEVSQAYRRFDAGNIRDHELGL